MAECSGPPQPARTDAVGTFYPSLEPVDSSTPRSAPLSRCTLLRHSSFVRAVCVDALVRIRAGGDQRWSSLPRQLGSEKPTSHYIHETVAESVLLVAPRHGFDVSSRKYARRSDDYRLQPTSLIHAKTAPLSRGRA